jgi:hypothetical protein
MDSPDHGAPDRIGITVISIAALILGLGSMFRHGCLSTLDPWFLHRPFWPGLDRPPGHLEVEAVEGELMAFMVMNNLFGLALAIMLFTLGVVALARSRLSRKAWMSWALLKIAHAGLAAALTVLLLRAQLSGIPDPVVPGETAESVSLLASTGLCVGLLVSCTFPAIVLFTLWMFPYERPRVQYGEFQARGAKRGISLGPDSAQPDL